MPVDDVVDAMRNDAYEINPRMRLHRARVTSTMTRFITAAVETYCPNDQSKIASIMANPAPGPNEPTHRVAAYTHSAVNPGSDLREPPPALEVINMPAALPEPMGTGVVRLPDLMDGGVFVAGCYRDDRSGCYVHGTALVSLIEPAPSGEITPPNPPQIPAPPPPTAQIRTPPRADAAPPPSPQELPPAPQELPPPAPPEEKPPPPEQLPPPQQVEPPAAPQPGGAAGSGGNGGRGPAEPSRTPHMPPGFVRLAP